MNTTVLILVPRNDKKGSAERFGDLFDAAFIEAVRTLAGVSGVLSVLVPCTQALAPLVMAATIDIAPAFDPEGAADSEMPRSDLVRYVPPGEEAVDADSIFWRASDPRASSRRSLSLEQALNASGKLFVLVLGVPGRLTSVRKALKSLDPAVVTFGTLVSKAEVAGALGVNADNVTDLEQLRPPSTSDDDLPGSSESATERAPERGLEQYIPFGLLLQSRFDEWLRDDEDSSADELPPRE